MVAHSSLGSDWKPWALAAGAFGAGVFVGTQLKRTSLQKRPNGSGSNANATKKVQEGDTKPALEKGRTRSQASSASEVEFSQNADSTQSMKEVVQLLKQLPFRALGHRTGVPGGGRGTNEPPHSTTRAAIVVASGKGGVGKSTISVNLAFSLQQAGLNVGLLDLDIYGPSLPELIKMPPNCVMATPNGGIVPLDYGGVALMSWGYVEPGKAATIRAPIASQMVTQLLTQVHWGDLDCLLIDSPPGTGDVLLSLSQTLRTDGAVLVTTGNEISVADLMKGIQLFEKVEIPTLAVCLNMAYHPCEACGHKTTLFADHASKVISKVLEGAGNVPLHTLPLDPQMSQAPDQPVPPRLQQYPYVQNPDFDGQPAQVAFKKLALSVASQILSSRTAGAKLLLRQGGSLELRLPGGDLLPARCGELRASCRCAHCVDENTGEVLIDQKAIRQSSTLHAVAVEPVGNYGAEVQWSDGHRSLLSLKAIEKIVGKDRGETKDLPKTGSSDW